MVAGEGVNDEDQPVVHVLLVAARRNMLEQLITLLNASKLQVLDIDSSVLSLCRGLAPIAGDKKYALLNLTDDMLNFMVIRGNEISMVRSIAIPDRTQDAVEELFKSTANGAISDSVLSEVGSMLASETSSSVSYYAMQNMEEPIESIYFVSGAGRADELAKMIAETIYTIPVEAPRFYEGMNLGLDPLVVKEFAGCIGLAMQALEG